MKITFHPPGQRPIVHETEESSIVVGRSSACDIVIKVEGISRQHCRIDVDSRGELFVTDLGSTNGVLIDNERLTPNQKTPYFVYQPLAIGGIPQVVIENVHPAAPILRPKATQIDAAGESTVTIQLEVPKKSRSAHSRLQRTRSVGSEKPAPSSANIGRILIITIIIVLLGTLFVISPESFEP
jgi:hypothetical protein